MCVPTTTRYYVRPNVITGATAPGLINILLYFSNPEVFCSKRDRVHEYIAHGFPTCSFRSTRTVLFVRVIKLVESFESRTNKSKVLTLNG